MSKAIWGKAIFLVRKSDNTETRVIVYGRERWALECLNAAGPKGCTPIDHPGPRWSAYVHGLRKMGVDIETLHGAHGEPFAGTHARYVLQCQISKIEGGHA